MSRALIFLFDGTANDPTKRNDVPTNIFRANQLIAESRITASGTSSQVTFYSPGIGTQFYATNIVAEWLQKAFINDSLFNMILRAYVNLSCNYREGDQIVILGFSRGAIACRLFARLIADFGILLSSAVHEVSDLLNSFSRAIDGTFDNYLITASSFRSRMGGYLRTNLKVSFLGLFDCVGGPEDDSEVRNFLEIIDDDLSDSVSFCCHIMSLHDVREHFRLRRIRISEGYGQEIWMPGVHSDVGGGYNDSKISDIALYTMAKFLETQAGIAIDKKVEENLRLGLQLNFRDKNQLFAINPESGILQTAYRSSFFRQDDRVHCFHAWLLNRPVNWKDEGRKMYEQRIDLQIDQVTARFFEEFLNDTN